MNNMILWIKLYNALFKYTNIFYFLSTYFFALPRSDIPKIFDIDHLVVLSRV